jgi:hypothetical protein
MQTLKIRNPGIFCMLFPQKYIIDCGLNMSINGNIELTG